MSLVQGKWIKLDQKGTGPGARSSHAITLVGQKAYVFGGEFTPRVPVDNKLHVFDLKELTWSVIDGIGDVPPPRVGVTLVAVGEIIYVFGGRDYEHNELNELYSFDTSANKWTLISSGDTGPPHWSYHSVASNDRHVYIFGGCGVAGRLNDLWAYNVVDQKWIQYPNPGDSLKGRGGPGLLEVQGKIWVVYGFAGEEVDDVHIFDPAQGKWAQVETSGEKPTARSVFSTVAIGKYIIIYGGEVDPSDLGHLGAGKFAAEVYALDTETLLWKRWDDGLGSDHHPGPRGWCAFARGEWEGKEGLLVYGGNSPTNDRLRDIHFFTPYLENDKVPHLIQAKSVSTNSSSVEKRAVPENEVEQVELLTATEDLHGGVVVDMTEPMDSAVFASLLQASISHWRQKGKRGVWIKLPIARSNLVDAAVKEGFRYHHAESDYLMLARWIPETEDTLPANASHRVAIGAFVMNSKREILVVQEISGRFRNTGVWKLPTGAVNEGEDICKAAVREVKEETGIDTEFVEVLAFRQGHKSFFQKSDLFFVCMLTPKSFDIQKQDLEIEAAQWMPVGDYAAQPFVKKNKLFDYVAEICLAKSDKDYAGFTALSTTTSSGKRSYLYYNKRDMEKIQATSDPQ